MPQERFRSGAADECTTRPSLNEASGGVSVKTTRIVWLAATLVNVNDDTGPWFAPSTRTLSGWNPEFGIIEKPWLAPKFTMTAPEGLMEPFGPAVAVIVYRLIAKTARIVWFVVTLLKVKPVTAP